MSASTNPTEFLTSTDIAARFGIKLAAVSNWRRRYGPDSTNPFPPPEDSLPGPVWRSDRWPEIVAWDQRRGGHRPGRRPGQSHRADNSGQYLTVSAIAARLNVTPGTVRRWRSARWPVPFPAPDKETQHGTRTVALWLTCRWPLIQSWRHAQLDYLAKRRHQPKNRRAGTEQDSGTPADRSTAAAPAADAAPPPPSHFLRVGRKSPRTGARKGRIVRASVRRLIR